MQNKLLLYRTVFWVIIAAGFLLSLPQNFSTSRPPDKNVDSLIISEFLAANQAGLTDEDGDHSDWIEIYNPGPQAVNLGRWSLTDDPDQPEKWTFPDISLDSQAYLLIFASGKNRKPIAPGLALHTNFKLKQEGEFLGLYNIAYHRFIDIAAATTQSWAGVSLEKKFPTQLNDVSYGRYGYQVDYPVQMSGFGYLVTPTPGNPNDETELWTDFMPPVMFNLGRGFYAAPITLELTTIVPGATIRYTLDYSAPTETHGMVYTASIIISNTTVLRAAAFKPNFRPSSIDTHTYIFLDDVLIQPKAPSGFPKTWGGYEGSPVKADYEMDPDITNDPRYSGLIKEALQSIPTLSIVTDLQSYHDLYANPRRRGAAWERPASIELIMPNPDKLALKKERLSAQVLSNIQETHRLGFDNSQQGFQINAGLRIQGESGRLEYMPKHSFRLFFREKYGAASLAYPLFPTSQVQTFDTLILRSGVNRSYAGLPEFDQKWTTYTRDEWLRASQIAMSGSGSHGIFVHLYLNGLYWGLYNVVERPNEAFMASYFGGAEDEWQAISHEETVSNTSDRFKTLHKLAGEGGLEDPEKYAAISTYLDIPHFIDYLILNWYGGNIDWAFNNWHAGVQKATGRVRYFVWDGERIWDDGAEIFMDRDEYMGRPNLVRPLFEALLENPDFAMALADRLYKHLSNDGLLTEANVQARWLRINQGIESAIISESARWGDVRNEMPLTQADWKEASEDVLRQMRGNGERLITLARQAGYYPELDPPTFNHPDKNVPSGFTVTLEAKAGAIYYTLDGTDPRVPGTGKITPQAQIYQHPLTLTTTRQLKSRAWRAGIWSALNEATFLVGDDTAGQIAITEIMYNPLGGDKYEFIELKNIGDLALDVSSLVFEGIEFIFAEETVLAPAERIVLVSNRAAFSERYPGVKIGGQYNKHLSNQGERIVIRDVQGRVVEAVTYDDETGWPLSADGWGDSLVRIDQVKGTDDPRNWRASTNLHGTPGH